MNVLLTAFGPFKAKDGVLVEANVTQQILIDLALGWKRDDCRIWASVLPVDWRAAEQILMATLELCSFDLAVFMGHAKGYKSLTLEARYFNKAGRPDMAGEIPLGGIVKPGGPEFCDSNIACLPQLAGWLNTGGISVEVHAGPEGMDYLCNLPGYLTGCHLTELNLSHPKYLVVHVPDPGDLPHEISLEGIKRIIHFLTNPL